MIVPRNPELPRLDPAQQGIYDAILKAAEAARKARLASQGVYAAWRRAASQPKGKQ